MCEFQVSRVFDMSSSLEKQLDTMVMLNDRRASVLNFQFPWAQFYQTTGHGKWNIVSHNQRLSQLKFSFFKFYVASCSKKYTCLMCSCLAICRFFFSLFHIACLGSILLFLVLAQPCPLIYCNRNCPADACSHNLFCLREFVTCQKKLFYFLKIICTSALNTHMYYSP